MARTLAQTYRRFDASPLYRRVAVEISESEEALRAIERAPARKRSPALILAALHDLALAGRAPASIETLLRMPDEVAAIAARRRVRTHETGPHAVLYPAIAEVARRAGADAVGLIDVGRSAALNLNVDRVGITYSDGQSLGDPGSPVQVSSSLVGAGPIPARALPEVVARTGIALDPLDVSDPDDARWLLACVPPDQPEPRLAAEIALAAAEPPQLLRGDAVELLPDAFARVPAGALPVVITTWALSKFTLEQRLRFLQALEVDRPVGWVSVEGVGVAPAIPRLGDRPAFGHSTIGLGVFDCSTLRTQAVGRCWSRGRLLSWPAQAAGGAA